MQHFGYADTLAMLILCRPKATLLKSNALSMGMKIGEGMANTMRIRTLQTVVVDHALIPHSTMW